MEKLFSTLDSDFGAPDVVVYNASGRARGPFVDLVPAEVEHAIAVSAFGGFLVARQAVRRMLREKRGVIIFTGASASVKGYPQSAPFAMGKFALRGMAQSMARELAPQGIVAAEQVARGPKDGYTLFMGTAANVINGVMEPNLPFDFAKDFTPIIYTTSSPNILVVHPSTGVTDVKGLIALLKAKPEQVFYGSSGVGTAPHLSGELFNMMAGTKMVHVPYSGSAQAVTDLLAGRIQVMFSPASTVLQYVEFGPAHSAGVLRRHARFRRARFSDRRRVRAAGFDTSVWFGVVGADRACRARSSKSFRPRSMKRSGTDDVTKPLNSGGLISKAGRRNSSARSSPAKPRNGMTSSRRRVFATNPKRKSEIRLEKSGSEIRYGKIACGRVPRIHQGGDREGG